MAEGCGAHGKLVSVAIVKPHHAQAARVAAVFGGRGFLTAEVPLN